MRTPRELPPALVGASFRLPEATRAGVSRRRLRHDDIDRPFHGVYTQGVDLGDLAERCAALLPSLRGDHWFSHLTAARLWRMPLPPAAGAIVDLDVLAVGSHNRARRAGVRQWETADGDVAFGMLGLVPVVTPADAWCQLAVPGVLGTAEHPRREVSHEWLVAAADFLLSGSAYDRPRHALCTRDQLAAALARRGGKRGVVRLREAFERARLGVDSPQETRLRLGLIDHGLPEPDIQVPVRTSAGLRHADLGYPAARVLLEFLGDQHRTSRTRWMQDLTRLQLFEDAGYRTIMVAADDLTPDCAALAARVRRALSAASR